MMMPLVMKRWFYDLESWWCVYGNRGGDSVLGVGNRLDQIRTGDVHVTSVWDGVTSVG